MAKTKKWNPSKPTLPQTKKSNRGQGMSAAMTLMGEEMLKQKLAKSPLKKLETSFGPVFIREMEALNDIKNKAFITNLFFKQYADREDEADAMYDLHEVQSDIEKYPEEPFLYHILATSYERLKNKEASEKQFKNNYERFKGEYPPIDIEYAAYMQNKTNKEDIVFEVFGDQNLNIHTHYPHRAAFEEEEVAQFYGLMATAFANTKQFEKARACLEVLNRLKSPMRIPISISLQRQEKPMQAWAIRIALILAILLIIGSLIWGLIALFRWIF